MKVSTILMHDLGILLLYSDVHNVAYLSHTIQTNRSCTLPIIQTCQEHQQTFSGCFCRPGGVAGRFVRRASSSRAHIYDTDHPLVNTLFVFPMVSYSKVVALV